MEDLDIKQLKRKPELFKTYFKVDKDLTLVNENIIVVFPERYLKCGLAIEGNNITVIGIYAVVDNYNNYCIINTPIFHILSPNLVINIKVGETIYKALFFNKGDIFLTMNRLVVKDNHIYNVFEEFYLKGNIPWFLNYEDIANIFTESKKYTGSNIGNDSITFEMLTSIIGRDPSDKKVYFRHSNTSKNNAVFVGLNNPYFSFNNTGAKLFGSRFGTGLNTALVEPEKKSSLTTDILRS